MRHRRNLPARGQRTHTNARTRKGPRRMAVKKQGAVTEEVALRRKGQRAHVAGQRQAEEEGPEEHPDRHRAHPVDVQQHARHRSPTCSGNVARVVVAPARAGSRARASATPVRRAARRRGRRQAGAWSTASATSTVCVKGPGAGPRVGAARAPEPPAFEITLIRDVTPIPHNGCRPPQAPPRLITSKEASSTWHATLVQFAGSAGVRT